MPLRYQIDHQRRLVWATAHGVLTDDDLFAYQRSVWSRPDVQGYDELVDMGEVTDIPRPTPSNIHALADLSAEMDPPSSLSRFAIVASDDLAYGLGRMYQTHRALNPRSGKEVRVFRTVEKALEWLEQK